MVVKMVVLMVVWLVSLMVYFSVANSGVHLADSMVDPKVSMKAEPMV